MRRRHSAAKAPHVRHVSKFWMTLAKYRRIALVVMLSLVLVSAGSIGFLLGNSQPASAASTLDDTDSLTAFDDLLAEENSRCALIEQVNLQDQLQAEQEKTSNLEEVLGEKQSELDHIEEKVLGVLMSNLYDQSVSRSSRTVSAYREEAANLVALSRKLNSFMKSEDAELIDLTAYREAIDKRLDYLPTIKPIPGVYDGYGYRVHPIYGYYHMHPAADVGASTGTKIRAAASGYVLDSRWGNGSGYFVKISHGNGFTTTYMHASKLLVKAGQYVEKGDVIALVGNTGSSTTPHLHYEIRYNGNPLNPRTMIME